jgi:hypothetical protein
VHDTLPKLKFEETRLSSDLKFELKISVLTTDKKPATAAHSYPMHCTVDCVNEDKIMDTFPDKTEIAPPIA